MLFRGFADSSRRCYMSTCKVHSIMSIDAFGPFVQCVEDVKA